MRLSLLFVCLSVATSEWIFAGVDEHQIATATGIGQRARETYMQKVQGVTDPRVRRDLYLDGLEECNRIDAAWTNGIQSRALRSGRASEAVWLEKAGLKTFTALFMTFPPAVMRKTVIAACSKHEKQLTCGAEFEGDDQTYKRIDDLKTIGNHRMMFEKECKDVEWAPRIYNCIGTNVQQWMGDCTGLVDSYSVFRESVNSRINGIYNTAVEAIKAAGPGPDFKQQFHQTMSTIAALEGKKCHLFKEMRICVLRRLLSYCGPEATRAFNTSASLGYLRTERRERLNLDFQVFQYPIHPACTGL